MNLNANKTDWWSYGYAATVMGFPLMLFALSFERNEAASGAMTFLPFFPFVLGVIVLFFTDRDTLGRMFSPFRTDSGRGTGRYLGLLGILFYSLGKIELMTFVNNNLFMNFGFVLLALSAIWYVIRMVQFKEQTL